MRLTWQVLLPVSLAVVFCMVSVALFCLRYGDRIHAHRLRQLINVWKVAKGTLRNHGLLPKLKIAAGFYQVICTLGDVYMVPLPQQYKKFMCVLYLYRDSGVP